jgi:Predicted AAA-ATPase/PD-(D/E)XK nuclease superfamily
MKKLLPISIQTFSKLREENCVYVDKTELIYNLTQGGGNTYFLSRPRRFGKSMTLSTLKSIYQGEKHLFEGLWIEDKWDWTRRNPVIHISFNDLDYKDTPLETVISNRLIKLAEEHDIVLKTSTYGAQFEELIQKLAKAKGKIVILIDEYDKPIIDYLEDPSSSKGEKYLKAKENRAVLRQFYACLKSNDYNIELFFMTGVSKFSQTGIFSHLNHLKDITLDADFATLVGYTHDELLHNFDEYIESAAAEIGYSKEEVLQDIKTWYNGYSWDAQTSVYNPYSVLLFFQRKSFESHWFRTGSPKFLIDIIRETRKFDFNQLRVSNEILDSYDIENLDIRTLMFQTGYLTIKEKNPRNGMYVLDYPNREVEKAISNQILALMTGTQLIDTPLFNAQEAFLENDVERVMEILNSMLADIPNQLLKNKQEDFYHSLVHLFFRYMGFDVESEVNTSKGRMDAVVQTDSHVYIFEFKIKKTAAIAFQQILDKKYADKYRMFPKTIIGIGVNFDIENKRIDDWKIEEL